MHWGNRLYKVAVFCILLFTVSLLITHQLRIPSIITLIPLGLELSPPSKSGTYFSARVIAASKHKKIIERDPINLNLPIKWRDEKNLSLDDFLKKTHTNAFVVIRGNSILIEKYFNGHTEKSLLPSYSISKSILSTMVNIALKKGDIQSINDDIRRYLPTELREKYSNPIQISHLLNMRAGIPVPETYDSVYSKIAEMYITTDLNNFLLMLPSPTVKAGDTFDYRSAEYLLLGEVLKNATRKTLSAYLQDNIWEPMGAESNASWNIDSTDSGIEKAFCCINATARDYARFGQLFLNTRDSDTLISPEWIKTIQSPTGLRDELAYSNGWWLPPNNTDGDFSAIGIHGQFIYINPRLKTVIVKLSDYEPEKDELLTLEAFQAITHIIAAQNTIH